MDLTFNKIAFCVLATGLVVMGLNELSKGFFHEGEGEAHAGEATAAAEGACHKRMGYCVTPVATGGGEGPAAAEEPKGPVDFLTLISAADPAAGEQVAAKCLQCHSFAPGGAPLQGPPLYDVMGRDIATYPGFKYSEGDGSLTAIEGVWDYDHLYRFLERPKGYAPNTAMNFVGLRKQQDRINLIAWMRLQHTGTPYAMPEPLPAQPVSAEAPVDPNAPPVEGAAPVDPAAAPADGAATAPAGAAPAAPVPATPAPAAPAP